MTKLVCGNRSSHRGKSQTSNVGRWIKGHGKVSSVDWATIEA